MTCLLVLSTIRSDKRRGTLRDSQLLEMVTGDVSRLENGAAVGFLGAEESGTTRLYKA
jgi:hypothetical protein